MSNLQHLYPPLHLVLSSTHPKKESSRKALIIFVLRGVVDVKDHLQPKAVSEPILYQ